MIPINEPMTGPSIEIIKIVVIESIFEMGAGGIEPPHDGYSQYSIAGAVQSTISLCTLIDK